MARGAGGLLDGGFVFKLGRLFRTPYGGEGVDFIDQLNYQFTGGLILIFIIIISLRQYVGKVSHPRDVLPFKLGMGRVLFSQLW